MLYVCEYLVQPVRICWRVGEVHWNWVCQDMVQNSEGRVESGQTRTGTYCNCSGISFVAHPGEGFPEIVSDWLGYFCEKAGILPKERSGFSCERWTTDMMSVEHRLRHLVPASNSLRNMCFIDLQEVYDPVRPCSPALCPPVSPLP